VAGTGRALDALPAALVRALICWGKYEIGGNMRNKRGEASGIEPPSLYNDRQSRTGTRVNGKLITAAAGRARRPPARRVSWLRSFPWRQLAWSALAGALAAVLAALALVWSGWTIG
jgi:hypothetical protein